MLSFLRRKNRDGRCSKGRRQVPVRLRLNQLEDRTVPSTIYQYDPGLGTLPEAQGFTRIQDAPRPEPIVAGGVLHQFPQVSVSV